MVTENQQSLGNKSMKRFMVDQKCGPTAELLLVWYMQWDECAII